MYNTETDWAELNNDRERSGKYCRYCGGLPRLCCCEQPDYWHDLQIDNKLEEEANHG